MNLGKNLLKAFPSILTLLLVPGAAMTSDMGKSQPRGPRGAIKHTYKLRCVVSHHLSL